MVIRRDPNDDEQNEALRRGLEGAERAQNAEDVPMDWQPDNRVEEIIREVAATRYEFTADDVWAVVEPMIADGEIDEPTDRRILGSLIKRVERDGLITGTKYVSSSTRRNASPLKVWRVNPNHAFSSWRRWGANQPGSEKVQAAKEGLDAAIAANRERLEAQREVLEELENQIQRDQNNSDELRRRGYNKKRIPTFDEIMSLSEDFDNDRLQDWKERTLIETDAPIAYYGFQDTWRSDDIDGFVPEVNIKLRFTDKETGEVIGQMSLVHRNEAGDIGESADRGIVGYQVFDISGRDEYQERMNKLAENWLRETYWKDAGDWSPGFFPLSIEDLMLERERQRFKREDRLIGDYIWEGKDLEDLMETYGNLFDEDGYSDYLEKTKNYRKDPILEDLEIWMSMNPNQRAAMIMLEEQREQGDEQAEGAIDDWRENIDEILVETGEINQREYGATLVRRAQKAYQDGKLTDAEWAFLEGVWDSVDPGFAELEVWSDMDIYIDGEPTTVGKTGFDYSSIIERIGLPNFEQFFEYDRFLALQRARMDEGEMDFNMPDESGINFRGKGEMYDWNKQQEIAAMNRKMRNPNTSKFLAKKPMMVNIADWGKPKEYVKARKVQIGEIGKRKTYVRPTTFRHRTYSNGRDPHVLYVADVRNTKSTQAQAQRQAAAARKKGYFVRTVKTADGWLNFFRQKYGPTGYEAIGYERSERMDYLIRDGGIYVHKPNAIGERPVIDLKRLPYQRRFGIFNVSPVERKNQPGIYDRKKIDSVKFSDSRKRGKKMKATFTFDDGTTKTTHFGGRGYSDYTLHKDSKRKQRYLTRHRKNENWNDPTSAGALSRWVLWNKESKSASIEDYKRRFGIDG